MIEIALIGWFPATILLFLVMRPHMAAAASMIFGVALLPALRAIHVPVMPDLDQYTVPVLGSFFMTAALYPQRLMAARPGTGTDVMILGMIAGALATNLTNGDAQVFGPRVLPGMAVTDTINDALEILIRFGMPALLGRALVRSGREAVDVLVILGLCGVCYLLPVLVELQIGPFWHSLFYGGPPSRSTFWHSMRYGGFRPNVLMNHGLTLSSFMLYCTIAWAGLARLGVRPYRLPPGLTTTVIGVVTAFCKSRAVYLYGVLAIPSVLAMRPRLQMLIVSSVAIVIIGYPFLRSVDLVPVKQIAEIAGEYAGYDAVVSFMQRIETEDDVMRRTSERYLFGWGGYSRFWIYDPVTGAPMSVMDGYWAMVFGEGGLTRFLFFFSFLLYPIFYGWRRIDKIRSKSTQVAICTLAWIVVLRTFDLIPNSTIDPYLTFFGGAICGVVRHESRRRVQAPSAGRRSEREREAEAGERQEGPASLAARLMSDRAPSR